MHRLQNHPFERGITAFIENSFLVLVTRFSGVGRISFGSFGLEMFAKDLVQILIPITTGSTIKK